MIRNDFKGIIIMKIPVCYISKKILIIMLALMMGGCGGQPPVHPSESTAVSDTPVPSTLPQASASSVQIVAPEPIIPPFYGVGTYKGKPDDDEVLELLSAAFFWETGTYGCALIDIDREMQKKLKLNPEREQAYVTNFDNAYEVDTYMSTYLSSSLYISVEAVNSLVNFFKVDGDLVWERGAMGWGHYCFSLDGWYWYNETTLAAPFIIEDSIKDGAFVLLPLVREEGEWKVGRIIYPNSTSDPSVFITAEDKLEEFEKNYVQDSE